MKSNFFLGNYDKAIEMGESLRQSRDLTDDQVNQINHIVGKSYYEKGNYNAAIERIGTLNDKGKYVDDWHHRLWWDVADINVK